MKPKIGITIGDVNGIGAEVALKALSEYDFFSSVPVLIGPKSAIYFYAEKFNIVLPFNVVESPDQIRENSVNILTINSLNYTPEPGQINSQSGKIAMSAIETSIQLCLTHQIDAMVTLPISKETVHLAGYNITGHTEFLAEKTDTNQVLMLLVNGDLRVALATAHVPISDVACSISTEMVIEKTEILHNSLLNDFGLQDPKIAVLGLNPHAGDGGVIGNEEINIIKPAIKELQLRNINAEGPFSADAFFGQKQHLNYDAVLAMYHDQGLAPFKLLSFGSGVNFTAGLPIIRTSPDHGTAFNIAGKGTADPSSFIQSYKLAAKLAQLKANAQ